VVAIGAGLDVEFVRKDTRAYVAGQVDASRDLLVRAISDEDVTSIVGTRSVGNDLTVAGSAATCILDLSTKAFIESSAVVHAVGNVLVSAEDRTEIDLIAGARNAALVGSAGAAIAAPVIIKTTEAYLATGATVTAEGNRAALDAPTGQFDIQYVDQTGGDGEVKPPGFFGLVKPSIVLGAFFSSSDATLQDDQSLTQQRVATPRTQALKGLAVTAVSRDDVETLVTGFDLRACSAWKCPPPQTWRPSTRPRTWPTALPSTAITPRRPRSIGARRRRQ